MTYQPSAGGPWTADDAGLRCDGYRTASGFIEPYNTVDGASSNPTPMNGVGDDSWVYYHYIIDPRQAPYRRTR